MEVGITRVLVAYQPEPGEGLVAQWPLVGIELPELRDLFGVADDNPMYDCWAVDARHVERLSHAVDHELDLTSHDYFVEAYRTGPEGDPRCPPLVLPAFPDAARVRPRTPSE
jgi:hypothetical protein